MSEERGPKERLRDMTYNPTIKKFTQGMLEYAAKACHGKPDEKLHEHVVEISTAMVNHGATAMCLYLFSVGAPDELREHVRKHMHDILDNAFKNLDKLGGMSMRDVEDMLKKAGAN